MKPSLNDMVDAIDEIDQCLEILRLVFLSMLSPGWEEADKTIAADVLGFTTQRIQIARDKLQPVR